MRRVDEKAARQNGAFEQGTGGEKAGPGSKRRCGEKMVDIEKIHSYTRANS